MLMNAKISFVSEWVQIAANAVANERMSATKAKTPSAVAILKLPFGPMPIYIPRPTTHLTSERTMPTPAFEGCRATAYSHGTFSDKQTTVSSFKGSSENVGVAPQLSKGRTNSL